MFEEIILHKIYLFLLWWCRLIPKYFYFSSERSTVIFVGCVEFGKFNVDRCLNESCFQVCPPALDRMLDEILDDIEDQSPPFDASSPSMPLHHHSPVPPSSQPSYAPSSIVRRRTLLSDPYSTLVRQPVNSQQPQMNQQSTHG